MVPFTDGWCMLVSTLQFCSSTPQQSGLPSEINIRKQTWVLYFLLERSHFFYNAMNWSKWAVLGITCGSPQFKLPPALVWRCRSSPYSSSSLQHHKTAVTIIQNHCLLPVYLSFDTARLALFCWLGCEERKALCVCVWGGGRLPWASRAYVRERKKIQLIVASLVTQTMKHVFVH